MKKENGLSELENKNFTVSPPVTETVMGIQFAPLGNLQIQHYGKLWEKFSAEFPTIEEHERLISVIESRASAQAIPAWKLVSGVQLPRVWFVGKIGPNGQYILQIQDDRFIMNWRTGRQFGGDYPSHDINIALFSKHFDTFWHFVQTNQLGVFEAEQCEISYVNHIPSAGSSPFASGCSSFNFFTAPNSLMGLDEHFSFNASSWNEELAGRIYTSVQSAPQRDSGKTVLDFRLTARGAPRAKSQQASLEWLDAAHRVVVGTFIGLTTKEMHNSWRV